MKIKLGKLTAALLIILSGLIAFPPCSKAASGPMTYYTLNGVNYRGSATVQFGENVVYGSTMVVASKSLPAGHIGAGAWVYQGNDLGGVNYYYTSSPSSVASVTGSRTKRHGSNYSAEGVMLLWNGEKYIQPTISRTPTMTASKKPSNYSVLEDGRTVGSSLGISDLTSMPDLVSAVTPEGLCGYIDSQALLSVLPDSPAEALKLTSNESIVEIEITTIDGKIIGALPIQFTAKPSMVNLIDTTE